MTTTRQSLATLRSRRLLIGGLVLLAGCAGAGGMASPLQQTYRLVPGMGAQQVHQLLGSPQRVDNTAAGIVWEYQFHDLWTGPVPYHVVFGHRSQALEAWYAVGDQRRQAGQRPGLAQTGSQALPVTPEPPPRPGPASRASSKPARQVTGAGETGAEGLFRQLKQGGYLDSYRSDVTAEIAGYLIKASDRWPAAQVNKRPRSGWINIYLVDADRLPEDGIEGGPGLELSRDTLHRNAVTLEGPGAIFLDTGLLKEIFTVSHLGLEGGSSVTVAVARVQTEGLAAFRQLWDASAGEASRRETKAAWAFEGALAFILAHEMGHVALGRTELNAGISRPWRLDRRARDELHACPEMLGPESQQRLQIERRADDIAAGLLAVQCQFGSAGPRRHEANVLGAQWYLLFALSSKLLAGGRSSDSPEIRSMLLETLGQPLYDAAMKSADAERPGAVHSLFPSSHPPDFERMTRIDGILARSSCGGAELGNSRTTSLYQSLLARNCAQLQARGGRQ